MSGEEGEGENDGDGDGKGGGGDGDCGDGDGKSHGEGKLFLAHVAAQISTIRVSAGSGAIQLMTWLRKKLLSVYGFLQLRPPPRTLVLRQVPHQRCLPNHGPKA